jgi:hypothetical protein
MSDTYNLMYADPYATVSQDMVDRAMSTEGQIIEEKQKIAKSFIKMAYLLDDFEKNSLYLARNFPDFTTWISSPDIDMSYRSAHDLLRIKREVIPALAAQLPGGEVEAIKLLTEVGISKTRALLPLVRIGKSADLLDELKEATTTTFRDLLAEVKEAGHNPPRTPPRFLANMTKGESFARIEVLAQEGETTEPLGHLLIRNELVQPWIKQFGGLLTVTP